MMPDREEQLIQAVADLTKMVGEIMESNIKLIKEKEELTSRIVTNEKALMKVIGEFERHLHNGLGIAVVPVS